MTDGKFQKVVMMGLGYIGLPTAALMAKHRIRVTGVDVNGEIVDSVNRGEIHIVEPDLAGLVRHVIEDGWLKASLTPEPADVFIIAVPTPFKGDHIPDISYVEQATRMVIPYLKEGNLFILESTSPVFTTEKMAGIIFSERPELQNRIFIAYCPERVLPGNILHELEHNDRVIGGIDELSTKAAIAFYGKFVKSFLHPANSRTAEMCKLVENSFRDVNIAFANELSLICDRAGINVWDLIRLANKHPRVHILQPGTGVGGHCIAVDPWFLVHDFPGESRLIRTSREVNNYKTEWVIEKVRNSILEFRIWHGKPPLVALMGLAFKPDIDDLRESPAKYTVNALLQFPEAEYLVVEPNIREFNGKEPAECEEAYEKADIVVFLVAHRQFYSLKKTADKIELDFCGVRK
jgi:UDP-N-acetyl-D-mannosaminuronic acid dehydrogenase